MSKIDITAIVNLHDEGTMALASFISVARAKTHAERHGLRVEVVAVLDRPSAETLDFVESVTVVDFFPVRVSYGDLGRARNAAVKIARGEWISFLDGDDLWAENWLTAAHMAATNDLRSIVWHPLALLIFGSQCHLFIHVDMEDVDFDLLGLSVSNLWASQSFAKRELYLSVPYPRTDLERQLGYEDWGWNIETISRGNIHKTVSDTVNAYRKKKSSLLQQTTAKKAMPQPTSLFRDVILAKSRRQTGSN